MKRSRAVFGITRRVFQGTRRARYSETETQSQFQLETISPTNLVGQAKLRSVTARPEILCGYCVRSDRCLCGPHYSFVRTALFKRQGGAVLFPSAFRAGSPVKHRDNVWRKDGYTIAASFAS